MYTYICIFIYTYHHLRNELLELVEVGLVVCAERVPGAVYVAVHAILHLEVASDVLHRHPLVLHVLVVVGWGRLVSERYARIGAHMRQRNRYRRRYSTYFDRFVMLGNCVNEALTYSSYTGMARNEVKCECEIV